MAISLGLKTIKLIVMILNFSYFIGMGWLIMCKTVEDIQLHHRSQSENQIDQSNYNATHDTVGQFKDELAREGLTEIADQFMIKFKIEEFSNEK